MALRTFRNIYKTYVEENVELVEIYTYRFSQDHLEHFFGAIRSKNGSNNNPNSIQFKASYKRLIVQNEIANAAFGNCHDFRNTETINIPSKINKTQSYVLQQQSNMTLDQRQLEYREFILDIGMNAAIRVHALEVLRKLISDIKCQACSIIVERDDTRSVVSICTAAEYEFKVGYICFSLKPELINLFYRLLSVKIVI